MIDIKLIRENKEIVKENIKKKFQDKKLPLVDEIKDLDVRVREVQVKVDGLKAEKNRLSGEIGKLMKDGKRDEAEEIKATIAKTADEISELEKEYDAVVCFPSFTDRHCFCSAAAGPGGAGGGA